jgi:hypothetical protein
MVSWLPYGIVFGRAFAPLRLCVKSFLPDGRLQSLAGCIVADRKVWPDARTGAKGRHHRKAGLGPDSVGIQRQGAKPPGRNRIFFITKPGNQESSKRFHGSWLPYGIVFGRAFAPWRLCVISFLPDGRLQSLAVCKDWPDARTGAKGQRPTPGRAGAGFLTTKDTKHTKGNWSQKSVKTTRTITIAII